jgi:hypothetical protein
MKMKVLAAIGTGLTITATIALAHKLPSNSEPVPVSFLASAREASGEFARCTARDAIAAGFLTYAHARLEVAPDQEPAWTHFTQSFQQALKPIETLCKEIDAKAAPPDTLSDLIERKEHSADVALQVLKSVRVAVSDLEASLKPEQKQRLVEFAVEFLPSRK